jgi:transposase
MNGPSNGVESIIAYAIAEMESEIGKKLPAEKVNLAELGRRTGFSRGKLRRLQKNGFVSTQHGLVGRKATCTVLTNYVGFLDSLLLKGIKNASVCFERLKSVGYSGSLTTVKRYIMRNKHLIPAKRQLAPPQENRGRRFVTEPGEAFQMDWGFTKVLDPTGAEFTVACFAMICHHCGQRYIEFFPNAKQENLFIGMLHAFRFMGIPKYVLTDNMKSVVVKRDVANQPIWQKDYEAFMKAVGFQTKLCKPRHPFTKGKVERLVRFVKENFLVGRVFYDISDLNRAALNWCHDQNSTFHKATDGVPQDVHFTSCVNGMTPLREDPELMKYLCPERRISFDGFVNYEGRRFGVPYSYTGSTARILRDNDMIYIYSTDMTQLLATHDVTWSKKDRFCEDQYVTLEEPEEFPSVPAKTEAVMLPSASTPQPFEKFNFDKEVDFDD